MTAFHFGSSSSPLFGYLHRPSGPPRGAVLLCSGLSIEERFAHQSLVWLGKRLAEERFTALRFDYRGTGDSGGMLTEVSIPMWVEDVRTGLSFLRSEVGDKPIHGLGNRTGANLLRQCAAGHDAVERLIYLDPVEDGAQWLSNNASDPDDMHTSSPGFAGWHELTVTLHRELRDLTWPSPNPHTETNALFVDTGATASEAGVLWADQYLHRPGPRPHLEIGSTGVARLPVGLLKELVAWMAS